METEAVYQERDAPEEAPAAHVLEDREEERARKRELQEAIRDSADRDEPPEEIPGAVGGSAKTMIAQARKHVGYREKGSNDTKFNRWFGKIPPYPHGGYGYPWCHSFLSYCLAHSRNTGAGPHTAGCESGVAWFRARARLRSTPRVGDFVYYGAGGGTHVELVTMVAQTTIVTIGGNTSGSLGGDYFNGDGVYEKPVKRSASKIYGYGRPAYQSGGQGSDGTSVKPITSIRTVAAQQEAVNALGYTPALSVDDDWGPKTEAGVKWLQLRLNVSLPGQWGQETEAKYRALA